MSPSTYKLQAGHLLSCLGGTKSTSTPALLEGWAHNYLLTFAYIGLWEKIGREDLLIRVTGGAVALVIPETNWK